MTLKRGQMIQPLYLCVLCQVLYGSFSIEEINCTTREILFGGLWAAMAMAFVLWSFTLLALFICEENKSSAWRNVVFCLVSILSLIGVAQTVMQQVQFYERQFGAGCLWVVLFAGVALTLPCTAGTFARCSRILLVLFCAAMGLLLLGFFELSNVQNLSAEPLRVLGVSNAFWVGFGLYPEYLVLFVSRPSSHTLRETKAFCWNKELSAIVGLPFFAVLVQSGFVLCSELIFGVQENGVGGVEILRSWTFLNFSRFDAIVVLLWLLIAFFRLRFLAYVAMQIRPKNQAKPTRKAGQVQ